MPVPVPYPQPWPEPGPWPNPYPQPVPPEPSDVRVVSPDGTRAVEITGYDRDAYLYDLTQGSPVGRWLAAGVSDAQFTSRGPNGEAEYRQVELSSYDGSWSAVDLNGTRKVTVSGDAREAVLYNLEDTGVQPVGLVSQATGVQFLGGDAGIDRIEVTYTDADGNAQVLGVDRDGAATLQAMAKELRSHGLSADRLEKTSGAFRSLTAQQPGW